MRQPRVMACTQPHPLLAGSLECNRASGRSSRATPQASAVSRMAQAAGDGLHTATSPSCRVIGFQPRTGFSPQRRLLGFTPPTNSDEQKNQRPERQRESTPPTLGPSCLMSPPIARSTGFGYLCEITAFKPRR